VSASCTGSFRAQLLTFLYLTNEEMDPAVIYMCLVRIREIIRVINHPKKNSLAKRRPWLSSSLGSSTYRVAMCHFSAPHLMRRICIVEAQVENQTAVSVNSIWAAYCRRNVDVEVSIPSCVISLDCR